MTNRVLGLCLSCSLAVHLFLGLYLGGFLPRDNAPSSEITVSLEYEQPPKHAAVPPIKTQKPAVLAEKKVPAPPKDAAALKTLSALPSPLKAKPATAAPEPQKGASLPVQGKNAGVKNSADLLMDPHKGKIFGRYFLRIKQKVYQSVHDQYMARAIGKGNVSLIFLVNRNGNLEDVYVLDKDTQAGPKARAFAVQCVRDSAPFDAFPKELSAEKICFNLTLVFDDF